MAVNLVMPLGEPGSATFSQPETDRQNQEELINSTSCTEWDSCRWSQRCTAGVRWSVYAIVQRRWSVLVGVRHRTASLVGVGSRCTPSYSVVGRSVYGVGACRCTESVLFGTVSVPAPCCTA